jgi:hypothetical protein
MLGNEKHSAAEIWIEHVGMSNQQRTGKAARGWFVIQVTHMKLETAAYSRATPLGCAFRRHTSCSNLFVDFFRRLISCVDASGQSWKRVKIFFNKVVAIGSKLV